MKLAFKFALALLAIAPSANAVTLINDNFNNVATGAGINGRTPTTSSAGGNWTSSGLNLLGNGSGGITATYDLDNTKTAIIDLGSGYLAANKGTYELSMDITHPTGSTNTSWVGIGFMNGNNVGSNLVGNLGNPWMLYRLNGNINIYGGNGITNPRRTEVPPATTGAALGATHNLKLVLNTAPTNWILQAFVDGYEFDINGTAAGNAYTFADGANPTSRYVGFSNAVNSASSTITSTADNFNLNFTAVPEPSALFLGAFGSLFLIRRKR